MSLKKNLSSEGAQSRNNQLKATAYVPQQAQGLQDSQDAVKKQVNIGRSAAIMSIATIVSRLTGFLRTWAMAFALGNTLLSSAYTVANNLPNMLYEMVVGGILVTAFLPVYVRLSRNSGQEEADKYASNIFTISLIFLGAVSVLCTIFSAQVIWTQSFIDSRSSAQASELASYFFKFFAIQIVLYGLSSIVSGLLNAKKDYFWSSVAPIFNNLVTIVTMLAYVPLSHLDEKLALICLGLGTSLGVAAMFIIQVPALKKNGIRLRLRLNLRDPALIETLKIGLPALLVMFSSSLAVSIQNAAALHISESGPSVISYARLWYTLPYSFLAVPISTTLFTELSEMYSDGDLKAFKSTVLVGIKQLWMTMIPFACYLVVFATPLSSLFRVGAFDTQAVKEVSSYLQILAPALPFYALLMYLNKVFSAARKMGTFSLINLAATALQIVACLVLTVGIFSWPGVGLDGTAYGRWVFTVSACLCLIVALRLSLGALGMREALTSALVALILGLLGAFAGAGLMWLLTHYVAPLDGSYLQVVLYLSISGLVSLLVSYGLAIRAGLNEVAFIAALLSKITGRFAGSKALAKRPYGKHFK